MIGLKLFKTTTVFSHVKVKKVWTKEDFKVKGVKLYEAIRSQKWPFERQLFSSCIPLHNDFV